MYMHNIYLLTEPIKNENWGPESNIFTIDLEAHAGGMLSLSQRFSQEERNSRTPISRRKKNAKNKLPAVSLRGGFNSCVRVSLILSGEINEKTAFPTINGCGISN